MCLFSVEGGMDFRAMLMKRKKPAKKVVVVSVNELSPTKLSTTILHISYLPTFKLSKAFIYLNMNEIIFRRRSF